MMTGNLSKISQDAIRNVKCLVEESIPTIAGVLGVSLESLSLTRRGHDLHVHVEHCFVPIEPTYQMGAIYVSLVSLLVGRRPRDDTTILGAIDIVTGAFTSQWKVDVYNVQNYKIGGFRRLVIGEGTKLTEKALSAAAELHEDGRPQVEIVTKGHILETLKACFGA